MGQHLLWGKRVRITYEVGSLPSLPTNVQAHILSDQFDLYHQII